MDAHRAAKPLAPFDHRLLTRLVFGNGTIERLGELARELGGKRVLLVTDSGVIRAGHAARAEQNLQASGLLVTVFDRVRENPTTLDVAQCVAVARAHEVDTLIGLGGGSAMDTAKGCNFIYTNGGEMKDYWGVGKATKPMRPLIAIPTTAGTGSECQSAALIADDRTHQKMACLDPGAAARVAILDPELTLSQPSRVTAATGIDAIAHAVESVVSTNRNPVSVLYGREAFRLCAQAFPRVLEAPGDLEARGGMLLGAAFAGLSIENSMLGAAHATANPLSARYAAVHGHAVGLMLPHVVRLNRQVAAAERTYAELARAAGFADPDAPDPEAALKLSEWLVALRRLAGIPQTLAELRVEQSALAELGTEAARQWTARFNPRPVTASDLIALYEAAWASAG